MAKTLEAFTQDPPPEVVQPTKEELAIADAIESYMDNHGIEKVEEFLYRIVVKDQTLFQTILSLTAVQINIISAILTKRYQKTGFEKIRIHLAEKSLFNKTIENIIIVMRMPDPRPKHPYRHHTPGG